MFYLKLKRLKELLNELGVEDPFFGTSFECIYDYTYCPHCEVDTKDGHPLIHDDECVIVRLRKAIA